MRLLFLCGGLHRGQAPLGQALPAHSSPPQDWANASGGVHGKWFASVNLVVRRD